MRILILLLLITILSSCDQPKKPYIEELFWPKRTVKLDNNLGVLTLRLPEEFDTFFTFTDEGCFPCDDFKKYRFQKNTYPKFAESGMFYKKADSIYSLTIIHPNPNNCFEKVDYIFDTTWRYNYVRKIKADDSLNKIRFPINSIEKILNVKFTVIGIQNGYLGNLKENIKNLNTSQLNAYTFVNRQLIELEFTCAASNCDSFIPKMYKALKTIEIKPN